MVTPLAITFRGLALHPKTIGRICFGSQKALNGQSNFFVVPKPGCKMAPLPLPVPIASGIVRDCGGIGGVLEITKELKALIVKLAFAGVELS
jgi:hypothetical protein